MRIASLPMYDLPGVRADWDALWAAARPALTHAGIPAPAKLSRPIDLHRHWNDPRLVLSQTCAPPWRDGLHRHTAVVGAFDFGLPGCPPGWYRSHLVVRDDECRPVGALRDRGRVAINGYDSYSGHGSLVALGHPPRAPLVTGAHVNSVAALRLGAADIAAIDAVSWRFLSRLPGRLSGLRIVGHTRPHPGTPVILSRKYDPHAARAAIAAAVALLPVSARARLGLRGLVPLGDRDYRAA